MKQVWKIVAAILAAIILAATGGLILWQFHTTPGLIAGSLMILLAIAIALPTQLHTGIITLKTNAQEIDDVVDGFIGRRSTDRRDDGTVVVVPRDLPDSPPAIVDPPATGEGA